MATICTDARTAGVEIKHGVEEGFGQEEATESLYTPVMA
jgi:hypothetical protein